MRPARNVGNNGAASGRNSSKHWPSWSGLWLELQPTVFRVDEVFSENTPKRFQNTKRRHQNRKYSHLRNVEEDFELDFFNFCKPTVDILKQLTSVNVGGQQVIEQMGQKFTSYTKGFRLMFTNTDLWRTSFRMSLITRTNFRNTRSASYILLPMFVQTV